MHTKFLRFAFQGVAYKFQTLVFRLALTPGCFSKCMEAALAPLRYKGIRILPYLDDFSFAPTRENMPC